MGGGLPRRQWVESSAGRGLTCVGPLCIDPCSRGGKCRGKPVASETTRVPSFPPGATGSLPVSSCRRPAASSTAQRPSGSAPGHLSDASGVRGNPGRGWGQLLRQRAGGPAPLGLCRPALAIPGQTQWLPGFQVRVHWGFCLRDSRGAGRAEGRALGGRWDRSGRNLGLLSSQEGNSSGHLDPALSPALWVVSSSL